MMTIILKNQMKGTTPHQMIKRIQITRMMTTILSNQIEIASHHQMVKNIQIPRIWKELKLRTILM